MDGRGVDELIPDLLALIFNKVPLCQRLIVIPMVCKSWAEARTLPFSWQEINLFPWTYRVLFGFSVPERTERVVRDLVGRSSDLLLTLCVFGLESTSVFFFIAEHGRRLQTLRIPMSRISDAIMEGIAARLSSVTFLDVSYCTEIGARGLQLIGNNCRHLRVLHRQMNYYSWDDNEVIPRDDEAEAIAVTMPNLQILQIGGHSMSTAGVRRIIGTCLKLQLLLVLGCRNVKALSSSLMCTERFPRLTVRGPGREDCFNERGYNPPESMGSYWQSSRVWV